MATISVFGLGYVGCVSLACFADSGHEVIGVDINPTKVAMINKGCSPIIEDGLTELLEKGVECGRVRATTNVKEAIHHSDISIICVGTPSRRNGSLNTDYISRVSQEIGLFLAAKEHYHVVAVRSTLLPGTCEDLIIPTLEETSGKKAGRDFGVCYNPEFLREGSSLKDFANPPYTVIGGNDERANEQLQALYAMLDAPLVVVPFKVAEMIKYASNAYHALKISFANEMGNICKQLNIDSHQLMDLFCQDTKLNISRAYLKPGFAFGGSCLPKDLRAILYHCRHLDVRAPVLEAILPSNEHQIDLAFQMIRRSGRKRVGALGFSFKAGTDDLRESPMVELIERLIGKGYEVSVYDKYVSLANLQGANRAYIEEQIPHIACLMADSMETVLAKSDVVVIGNNSPDFRVATKKINETHKIIDLVRLFEDTTALNGSYQGISW
jgi:GDP-mannose 6-dehydrogenase